MQNHICVSPYNFWNLSHDLFKKKTLRKSGYQWLSISLSLALSGCMGIYEGGFECPPGKGVGCKSISEVNRMVNAEILPPKTQVVSSPSDCKECESSLPPPPVVQESSDAPQIWWAPSKRAPIEGVPFEGHLTEQAPKMILSQRIPEAKGKNV